MGIGVSDLIAGIFKPAANLIDKLHTSTDEKLQARGHLLDVQAAAMQRVFDYEREQIKGQHRIVANEAKSEHLIVAAWRPITMLTFLVLAVGDSLGLLATPLRDEAWTLLQLGLGGYVVGRSGEKIAKVMKG
ncbi:MAG: holin family protein [Gammaproteobacteria bacterium]|nr:holin family protein [Gammaproteobacteria bacterium]